MHLEYYYFSFCFHLFFNNNKVQIYLIIGDKINVNWNVKKTLCNWKIKN